MLDQIAISAPEWVEQPRAEPPRIWYHESAGDGLGLYYFGLPPNIPGRLEQVTELRAAYGSMLARDGVGFIELDVLQLAGMPAVRLIIKVPQQPHGMTYVGSFTIPRRDFSFVLKVQCEERGTTGMRDSIVLNEALGEGRVSLDDQGRLAGWFADPYDPSVVGPVMRNQSDDARYDERFPTHPLSRLRGHLRALEAAVRVSPRVAQAPPFAGPA